jgi:hypothetical protein
MGYIWNNRIAGIVLVVLLVAIVGVWLALR